MSFFFVGDLSFFRILKLLCYFATYGFFVFDIVFWRCFLTLFFYAIFRRYFSTSRFVEFFNFFNVVFLTLFFEVVFWRYFSTNFSTIASFRIGVPSILFNKKRQILLVKTLWTFRRLNLILALHIIAFEFHGSSLFLIEKYRDFSLMSKDAHFSYFLLDLYNFFVRKMKLRIKRRLFLYELVDPLPEPTEMFCGETGTVVAKI